MPYVSHPHQVRDAQKSRDQSADAMLKLLREEVTKNRTTYSRIVRESQEKGQNVQQFEKILSEPAVTQSQISNNDVEIESRKNDIHHLEEMIAKQGEQDGKSLTIYRQQAQLVSKKKDMTFKEKRSLEEERDRLHQQLILKEREYEQFKGHKFLNRDEFKKYANNLRDKTAKFKYHKSELAEIRQEVAIANIFRYTIRRQRIPPNFRRLVLGCIEASKQASKYVQSLPEKRPRNPQ